MKTKKPVRITAVMARVINAMAGGAVLRSAMSIDGRAWLDTMGTNVVLVRDTVSHSTVWSLAKRGLIASTDKFPVRKWKLTALGRKAAKEAAANV